MSYVLIGIFLLAAIALFWIGSAMQKERKTFFADTTFPSEDRTYWKELQRKFFKAAYVGAIGALLTALAIAIKMPIPAEVGCITLMAALVFSLAAVCRKTGFTPCTKTEKIQKKLKLWLLVASVASLLLTQGVFDFFV